MDGMPLVGHTNLVRAIALSNDGRYVASGADDGAAILWDSKSGQRCSVVAACVRGLRVRRQKTRRLFIFAMCTTLHIPNRRVADSLHRHGKPRSREAIVDDRRS
jgi:WD40 repeat protein